jgi:predicted Rdx family selenoprotein
MAQNKITLTFSTTAGDLKDDFPMNQPLHATKREVMARLKLDPHQADQFIVTLNGNPLDEQKTLGELGIPAGSVLIIERREVVKI